VKPKYETTAGSSSMMGGGSRNVNPNSLTRTRFRSTLKEVRDEVNFDKKQKRKVLTEGKQDLIAAEMDFVAEQLAME